MSEAKMVNRDPRTRPDAYYARDILFCWKIDEAEEQISAVDEGGIRDEPPSRVAQ
jgi:hypothetical protein